LADAGGEILFRRVTQRPGAPLVGGAAGETLFYGLPGNPVSVMVCFEVHVRAVIRFMGGHRRIERPTVVGTFDAPFAKPVGLTMWARVIARQSRGRVDLTPSAPQGSGVLRSMALGNGLAELPPELAIAGPDDPITVHLFDDVE
jgi:molybdopterin molybdotransferase